VNTVYKELAVVLDRIPNGYPATESGVELQILAALFTPEQAALACQLELEPQMAKTIATRCGGDERQIHAALKEMTKKGLIKAEKGEGGLAFKLMPFVVGIYEELGSKMSPEFAHLFEHYYLEGLHKMMAVKPSVHRVLPAEKTIPVDLEVMPYERASYYVENARAWGVVPCMCRTQRRLVGHGCQHTVDNCLIFSSKPGAFDHSESIRALSKEEALQVLAAADQEGLVHSASNVLHDISYICNCCICSCTIIRGIADFGHINGIARSDFFASVNETLCVGCGACVERCQFNAITINENMCHIDRTHCFGCGLCTSVCPAEALSLQMKNPAELETPPRDEAEWRTQRLAGRKEVNY